MSIRILPADEYYKMPYPADPASSVIVVMEDDETKELTGFWVAQTVIHIEPVWLSPSVRGGLDGLKMYAGMMAALSSHGATTAYAFADRPEIASYLERLNAELLPYVVYKLKVPTYTHESETPEPMSV